ncbi:hypothetical protein BHMPCIPO_01783 [Ensifer sesbaniae]|nr:hypothetical protein [Ensifer sesbaniae]
MAIFVASSKNQYCCLRDTAFASVGSFSYFIGLFTYFPEYHSGNARMCLNHENLT